MTRLDPAFRLARLVVLKDGERAYDEHFHLGINIIRGVPGDGNSVGKSTIADLIFFVLGGDLIKWKDEAALCDVALAEVVINGVTVTLRREIVEAGLQPMWVYFGNFDASQTAGADDWQKFPYKRYGDKESFTQVLFRLMNMPQVAAPAESNITMHQLLLLMYVDQMTPVDRIFRFEARDSPLRRQAVGDLLCGAFDDRIYPAQLELREKERFYEQATQQYAALNRVVTGAGESFNLNFIEGRQHNVAAEIAASTIQVRSLKGDPFSTRSEKLGGGKHCLVA